MRIASRFAIYVYVHLIHHWVVHDDVVIMCVHQAFERIISENPKTELLIYYTLLVWWYTLQNTCMLAAMCSLNHDDGQGTDITTYTLTFSCKTTSWSLLFTYIIWLTDWMRAQFFIRHLQLQYIIILFIVFTLHATCLICMLYVLACCLRCYQCLLLLFVSSAACNYYRIIFITTDTDDDYHYFITIYIHYIHVRAMGPCFTKIESESLHNRHSACAVTAAIAMPQPQTLADYCFASFHIETYLLHIIWCIHARPSACSSISRSWDANRDMFNKYKSNNNNNNEFSGSWIAQNQQPNLHKINDVRESCWHSNMMPTWRRNCDGSAAEFQIFIYIFYHMICHLATWLRLQTPCTVHCQTALTCRHGKQRRPIKLIILRQQICSVCEAVALVVLIQIQYAMCNIY